MNRRSLIASVGAAALTACTSTSTPPLEATFAAELDAVIGGALARLGVVPGLAVAIYSREGAYARGFGVTNVETGERASADTAFYIASSTKPLTALAFSALASRGELSLDQTVAAFAPGAPFPMAVRPDQVKLRDLLTHTSGIVNNPIGHRLAFSGQHDPQTLWRLLGESSANSEAPLGRFQYTNVGYNIATILSDERLGVRWQDLLQREVFGPAGMTRTSAIMSRAARWSVAKPHTSLVGGGPSRLYLEKTDQTMQSAGGVIMSANDAAKWLALMVNDGAIDGRQIMPAAAIQATRAPLAQVGSERDGYAREHYGLGWYMGPHRDGKLFHHFGSFAGFRAHVSYMPERGVGVAAFANDSGVSASIVDLVANYLYDRLNRRDDAATVFAAALGDLAARHDALVPRLAADRQRRAVRPWTLTRAHATYAGAYESRRMGRVEVDAGAGALTVRFGVMRAIAEPFTDPDSIRVELEPFSGDVIVFDGNGPTPGALVFKGERFERVQD